MMMLEIGRMKLRSFHFVQVFVNHLGFEQDVAIRQFE